MDKWKNTKEESGVQPEMYMDVYYPIHYHVPVLHKILLTVAKKHVDKFS